MWDMPTFLMIVAGVIVGNFVYEETKTLVYALARWQTNRRARYMESKTDLRRRRVQVTDNQLIALVAFGAIWGVVKITVEVCRTICGAQTKD
jgi:uncharacterized membrane protein (DUF4010 family)